MNAMQYDMLNLGVLELQFGHEILARKRPELSFPFLASNLQYDGQTPSWAEKYIIREVGGINIAFVGIVDPKRLPDFLTPEQKKVLKAVSPEETLRKLVPEVRKKADLVVLLSQLSTTELLSLFQTVPGIDVSITAGCREFVREKKDPVTMHAPGCGDTPEDDTTDAVTDRDGPILLYTGPKGMALGKLTVMLDSNGDLLISQSKPITLNRSVADHPEMAAMVDAYKEKFEAKEAELKQKLTKGLNMSPEEFMNQYQKNQP